MQCLLFVLFCFGCILHILLEMLMNQNWAIEYMFLILAIVDSWWHHGFNYSTRLYLSHRVNELCVKHPVSRELRIIWRILNLLRAESISVSGFAWLLSTLSKLEPFSLPSFLLLLFLNDSLLLIYQFLLSLNILEKVFVLWENNIVSKYFCKLLIKTVHFRKPLNRFKLIIITPKELADVIIN